MTRTNFPYGSSVKINNPRFKRKSFYFLRLEKGQAVIFFWGVSDKASFTLLVNPLKVFRKKQKTISPERLVLLTQALFELKEARVVAEENHIHSFPIDPGDGDELVCVRCNQIFKRK